MQLQVIKVIIIIFYINYCFNPCQGQESFVVRITASDCSYSDSRGTTNILTGFFLKEKGIITALHGVCGCRTIAAEDAAGRDLGKVYVSLADLENDVALLASEHGIDFSSGFEFSNVSPSSLSDQNIKMIGFGHGVSKPKTSMIAKVRNPAVRSLIDCIKPNHKDPLRERNSPNIYNQVLDVEIPIAPGCSGAPIIFNGKVIGIADGGLEGGSTNYCWAIPAPAIDLKPKNSLEPEYSRLAQKNPAKIFVLTSHLDENGRNQIKTVKEKIEGGELFRIILDGPDCGPDPNGRPDSKQWLEDNDFAGALVCGGVYEVYYIKATNDCRTTGPDESDGMRINSESRDKIRSADMNTNRLSLWGHKVFFDDEGRVFRKESDGRILRYGRIVF